MSPAPHGLPVRPFQATALGSGRVALVKVTLPVWFCAGLLGSFGWTLATPCGAHAAEPAPELKTAPEVHESAPDYDDFSVPDDASFEPLWDPSAYPDLQFTAPGCTLDIAGGHRTTELGSEWFFGAFVALPLGGPCLRGVAKSGLVPGAAKAQERSHSDASPPRGLREVVAANPAKLATSSSSNVSTSPGGASEPGEVRVPDPGAVTETDSHLRTNHELEVSEGSVSIADWTPELLAELIRRLRVQSGTSVALVRLDRLSRQERASGLLPELRLRGAYGMDQSLALETVGSYSGEATARGGSDSVVEARLTFHLDRLLAPQNSATLERLRQDALEREAEQVETGLELLSAVGEFEAMAQVPTASDEERTRYRLRARAARMRLHVLTLGWFPLEPGPSGENGSPKGHSRDAPTGEARPY
jgi:hypothetical protein